MKAMQDDLTERRDDAAATTQLRLNVIDSIDKVGAAEWDACANPDSADGSMPLGGAVQTPSEQARPDRAQAQLPDQNSPYPIHFT